MVIAVTGIALLLVDMGFSTATIQAQVISSQQRANVFWINLAAGLVASAILVFSAPLIAHFYGLPLLTPVVQVSAVAIVLQAITAQFSAEASRQSLFGALALADVVAQVGGAGVAIALAFGGFGVWSLVAQQLAVATLTLVVVANGVRWRPGLPRRAKMRSLVGFGFNTLGVQAVNYASANVDSVALGRVWGPATLGYYDRAYQLFKLPVTLLLSPLTRVVLPKLSSLQSNAEPYARAVEQLQLVIAYVAGSVFLLASVAAEPLVITALGTTWAPSAGIFSILAVGGFFQTMGYVYYWVFLSKALTGLQLRYALVTRSLMVAMILIGVHFGAYGVAVAVAAGLAVNWLVLSVGPMRRTGVSVARLMRVVLRPLLCHVTAMAAVYLVVTLAGPGLPPWLTLILSGTAALLVYGLLALTVRAVRIDCLQIVRVLGRRS